MADANNNLKTLVLAGVMAAGLFGVVHLTSSTNRSTPAATAATPVPAGSGETGAGPVKIAAQWAASAPGRVEPRGGEVRIGAQAPGRIVEVTAEANDRVRAGDLLVRLDDEDARAKVLAAEAEAAARKRDRDAETVGKLATDRRNAEDAVATAERALVLARYEHDRVLRLFRASGATEAELDKVRADADAARTKLADERDALRRTQALAGMPLPTRLEAGLIAPVVQVSRVDALVSTYLRGSFIVICSLCSR